MEHSNVSSTTNRLTMALFIIYLIVLYWILLLKLGVQFSYMDERRLNLDPFGKPFLTSEAILNVVIFLPLGIYAGMLFKKWSLGTKLLFILTISLLIETLQYILRIGAFDITDLITNTSGGLFGLVIYKLLEKIFNNQSKAQKFINVIAAIGTAAMILLLVLLKMNMLPIRYQ